MEENKNYKEIYGDFECPDCGRSTKMEIIYNDAGKWILSRLCTGSLNY